MLVSTAICVSSLLFRLPGRPMRPPTHRGLPQLPCDQPSQAVASAQSVGAPSHARRIGRHARPCSVLVNDPGEVGQVVVDARNVAGLYERVSWPHIPRAGYETGPPPDHGSPTWNGRARPGISGTRTQRTRAMLAGARECPRDGPSPVRVRERASWEGPAEAPPQPSGYRGRGGGSPPLPRNVSLSPAFGRRVAARSR